MMNKLKADILQARKDKNTIRANVLNTMVADICRDVKEPTDEQVERGIKKFLKSIEKSIDMCKEGGAYMDKLEAERDIVLEYVPDFARVTPSDFKSIVDMIFDSNPDNVASAKEKPQNVGWFVGQTMKEMQGKANPNEVKQYVMEKLA